MTLVIDLFRWGVEKSVVPVATPQALREVKRLRKGKSEAKETEAVQPVGSDDLEKALDELQPTLRDMVRVQLLMGARPNEVCVMRVGEITIRTDGAWCYRPRSHKTTHRGKDRRLFIGPQGQELLRPYLEGKDGDEFVFTHTWKGEPRRYQRESYTQAITRACERARTTKWTANQLRHTRATDVRSQYDLETAAAVLGHASPNVTLIYAETNFKKAAEVASKIG
jgi:integrase